MGARAVVAAIAVLGLGACQAPDAGGDKAGTRTVVLRLATIDAVNNNGVSYGPERFVLALEEVSDGRLKVEVDTDTFSGPGADEESRLVEAIAAGEVDGGWPSTRAFAAAGLPGLEAVEAPFVLTSYDAVRELVRSPTAARLLGRLDGSGVRPLALAVGPLRRPFAADAPLLGPEDWAHQPIRSFNSPVQDATIRALGGVPRHVGHTWFRDVADGDLRGLEFDVAQYHHNGRTTEAGHITTNVVLWPKVFVLSLSDRTWSRLDSQQRAWVTEAADQARDASVEGEYDDNAVAMELCSVGATLHEASPEHVAGLREAVAPVLGDLATDPVMQEIRAIGARHPADQLHVERCLPASTPVEVTAVEDVPARRAPLPDGTYRVELTAAEIEQRVGPGKEAFAGIWTLRLQDGSFEMDCQPLPEPSSGDCDGTQALHDTGFDVNPMLAGTVHGDDDTAYFVNDPRVTRELSDCVWPPDDSAEACYPRLVNKVSWRQDGEDLVFDALVSDSPDYELVVEPWARIE